MLPRKQRQRKRPVSEESESTAETAPESAAAESKTVSVSEPVDPQAEVKEAFEKLLAIRTEPDPDEWQAADKKLVAFGKTAVPTLKEGLTHTDPGARELASMYLASWTGQGWNWSPELGESSWACASYFFF